MQGIKGGRAATRLLAACVLAAGAAVATVTGLAPAASAAGVNTVRLQGPDRDATAIAISQSEFADHSAGAVVLSRDDLFPDGLSGSPLAFRVGGPLLITPSNQLDSRVEAEIQRVLPAHGTVYILGTADAISTSVEVQLHLDGFNTTRLGGADRFETASKVANYIDNNLGGVQSIWEATGNNFPDALSGSSPAALDHGAILLTQDTTMNSFTQAFISSHSSLPRFALGDQAVTADSTLPPPPHGTTDLAGATRFETSAAIAENQFPTPPQIGAAYAFNFPDALAGGVNMAQRHGPVLLVDTNTPLPDAIASYAHHQPTVTTVVGYGGTAVISDDVLNALVNEVQS